MNRLYRELRKRFHLIRIQENKLSNENFGFVMDVKEIIVDFYVDEFKDSEIMSIFHEDILVTLGRILFCRLYLGQGGYLRVKK